LGAGPDITLVDLDGFAPQPDQIKGLSVQAWSAEGDGGRAIPCTWAKGKKFTPPLRSGRFISPWSNTPATDDMTKKNYKDTGYAGCMANLAWLPPKIGETWIAAVPVNGRQPCHVFHRRIYRPWPAARVPRISARGFFFHRRQGPFCGSYLDLNAPKKEPRPWRVEARKPVVLRRDHTHCDWRAARLGSAA